MHDEGNEREETIELMLKAAEKGRKISRYGSDLQQSGQYLNDFAEASIPCTKYPLPGSFWESSRAAWQYANDQADVILGALGSMTPYQISSSTATTSGSIMSAMATCADPATFTSFAPPEHQVSAREDSERLRLVFNRVADRDKVQALLRDYGFTSAVPGVKSPLELHQEAWAAYEKPATESNPASTSLLPMRECINESVDVLMRRRPILDRAGSHEEKIQSIGKQLGRDGIPRQTIDSLATQRTQLNDKLSDAKTRQYSRQEWTTVLHEANQFLYSLLSILDPHKFRT